MTLQTRAPGNDDGGPGGRTLIGVVGNVCYTFIVKKHSPNLPSLKPPLSEKVTHLQSVVTDRF